MLNEIFRVFKIFLLPISVIFFHVSLEAAQSEGLYGVPGVSAPCPEGSEGMYVMSSICHPTYDADRSGEFLIGKNAEYKAGGFVDDYNTLLIYYYVPYSGQYKLRLYICSRMTSGPCTIKASTDHVDGMKSVYLPSDRALGYVQGKHFGGASRNLKVPYAHSYCMVFVDDNGSEWSGSEKLTCQDGHLLPEQPATCYINYGGDLDVDMGTLERSDIVATPGTSQAVKKEIAVLCTRDAGTTVNMQFQFTPLSISGNQVIQTSSEGLGVAIKYKGKVISPTDTFTETYALGYSSLDLEFEAVRDPNVDEKDIPTGEFTANAVLIMTEQ